VVALLVIQLPEVEAAALSLVTGTDTLGTSTKGVTSSHSIAFTTKTNLVIGDKIQLYFSDFTLNLSSADNVSVTTGPSATASYSNSGKTITLALTTNFNAGNVVISVAAGKITNPATEGEYSVSILTFDTSNGDDVLDTGIAKAGVANIISVTINIFPVVTNVTSSKTDAYYLEETIIPIQVTFSGTATVSGTPKLTLNSGGTANYTSGSGSSTLTFNYEVGSEDAVADLDYSATNALSLNGGSIVANGKAVVLTLSTPGEARSLGYNKNIGIGAQSSSQYHVSVSYPEFSKFLINDTAGKTSDSTPVIEVEARNEAKKISLSCNGGTTWSNWIVFPIGKKLNNGSDSDFNILSGAGCDNDEGLKTIQAKVANSSGYESTIISDSTIYEAEAVVDTIPHASAESENENEDVAESAVGNEAGITATESTETESDTVLVTTTLDIPKSELSENASDNSVIEVGYADENGFWKSFRDFEVQDSQVTVSAQVEKEYSDDLEVRVIEVERLEDYSNKSDDEIATENTDEIEVSAEEVQIVEIITDKPILPINGGEIPIKVRLITSTDEASESTMTLTSKTENKDEIKAASLINSATAIVEISAETKVSSSESNYEGVIYAPEIVKNPPKSSEKAINNEVFFVGSSSGDIEFDRPIKLTLFVKNKNDPKIYHFDEKIGDWIMTMDAVSETAGGELSEDGETVSIWVDHMTLFTVIDKEDFVKPAEIKRIAIGADAENRADFTSGEWFSSVDIGNDNRVSFAWSGNGEKFHYVLDDNSSATSLLEISKDTEFTENFYLDKIRINEGESYFHISAEDEKGKRSEESVFVINYDKTAPQLAEVLVEKTAGFEKSNEIDLKFKFSEEITTPDSFIVYFASGEILEIPTIKSATAEIGAKLVLAKADSFEDLEIISIIGMLIDRAGLVAINPQPVASNFTISKIQNAEITVLYPAQLVEGRYLTSRDSVNVRPNAKGATKMRLVASVLDAKENEWQDYSGEEIEVPLTDFGAQKILLEFSNEVNERQFAGAVVTRFPANSAELADMQKKQSEVLSKIQAKISAKLKSLFTWGVATKHEEILAKSSPAIFPSADVPTAEEIKELNLVLGIAQKIQKETSKAELSMRKFLKLAEELAENDFTLDDFFTLTEINSIFAKISDGEIELVQKYLDPNTVSFLRSGEKIRVDQLSLGMRDSDGDGISDALEIVIGSNPFLADSDGDKKSDGEEFLDFGSDLMKKVDFANSAGFVNLAKRIEDPRPLLRGVSDAGEDLKVVAVNANGESILLGKTTANADGKWLLLPEVVLPAGSYELKLKNEVAEIASQKVEINLDFILLPPKIHTGKTRIFTENQPAFFGNTFYEGRVIGVFVSEGRIASTAVIADNSFGDFVIRPPQPLAAGEHTLITYVELADGTRSPARSVEFEIKENENLKPAASSFEIFSRKNIAIGTSFLALLISGFLVFVHRRKFHH